jgi:hypothetical protein
LALELVEVIYPASRPGAVNFRGLVPLPTPRKLVMGAAPELGGNASNTLGGTVKLPALMGAMQVNTEGPGYDPGGGAMI